MAQTVCENMEGFTPTEVEAAASARNAQMRLGSPSNEHFKKMASSPTIQNLSMKLANFTNVRAICGPNRPNLKGEKACCKPSGADMGDHLDTPRVCVCRESECCALGGCAVREWHSFLDHIFEKHLPFHCSMSPITKGRTAGWFAKESNQFLQMEWICYVSCNDGWAV